MNGIAVERFGPVRPWVEPGTSVSMAAVLRSALATAARVRVELLDLDVVMAADRLDVRLGPGTTRVELELDIPTVPRHGYGLRLAVEAGSEAVATSSAVEALAGWWESPRHAAVTGYESPAAAAAATHDLVDWHVNVIQHYDWMWRHYRYRPPDGASSFVDPLGRTVSHEAVRASVDAGHQSGIASLAYGAVYGAEPEHVERYPDDRVFDDDGEPLSLGGAFYINDLRPGSAWRSRVLDEYADALANFGFDGIHMDTYGPPHDATAADGEALDFAMLYPGLIGQAAELVGRTAPGARVLFNCVEGFPLDAVAPAPVAALYVELWPPDDSFADVVRWIDRARALADGRQVVIAAYATTLDGLPPDADRAAAFEAVPLLGSVIAAAGAYHHTLAEGDRLLVEGYYPAAVAMEPDERATLRALWRFCARYVHLLSDSRIVASPTVGLTILDAEGRAVPWTTEPTAGAIWTRATETPDGRRILHLIDLREQDDTDWTKPKRVSAPTASLHLDRSRVAALVGMSPWSKHGDAVPLERGSAGWVIPSFRRWLVLVER